MRWVEAGPLEIVGPFLICMIYNYIKVISLKGLPIIPYELVFFTLNIKGREDYLRCMALEM